MNWPGAAPCQCQTPASVTTVSPALTSSTGPPRSWTRATPSVTYRVCPCGWLCQAVRAPGAKCTLPRDTFPPPERSLNHTAPVNHSAGPCIDPGCSRITRTPDSPLLGPAPPVQDIGLLGSAVARRQQ